MKRNQVAFSNGIGWRNGPEYAEGTVLAAFMGKIHPFALDISSSPWDAAKVDVTKLAMDFRDRIDKSHGILK